MARTQSRWRAESERIITETLARMPPHTSEQDARTILREVYPFGQKINHPYRIWCDCVRKALAVRFCSGKTPDMIHPVFRLLVRGKILWLDVDCPWCDSQQRGCIVCCRMRGRVAELCHDPEFLGLRSDPDMKPVLIDWLADRGIEVTPSS